MNYIYKKIADLKPLYEYYRKIRGNVPYWLDADFDLWLECMQSDRDYDGDLMFSGLETAVALSEQGIEGFVQYGISRFVYGEDGKDFGEQCGIIRGLYFGEGSGCGRELVRLAEEYFAQNGVKKRSAFYHAFGMTCNAGHGKLFGGLPHIEQVLLDFGYIKEHENVYYSRRLTELDAQPPGDISVEYGGKNPQGKRQFTVKRYGEYVGAGELVYLPQGEMCYLRWIYTEEKWQGKGCASAALRHIFADLYADGIRRTDTDTADGNLIAQRLYLKVGFTDMGRTRSYLRKR